MGQTSTTRRPPHRRDISLDGAVAAVVIIGAFLLLIWLAFGVFGEGVSQTPVPPGT